MALNLKPDYAGESLAACRGSTLSLYRGILRGDSDEKSVPTDAPILAAAWNRNNKVVAAARADGIVELRYSNGAPMSVLPREGIDSGDSPLTSLAWSMGSKLLAAGCLDGTVHVHNMVGKTFTRHAVDTTAITAVEYHPDDTFLAAAGRKVNLLSTLDTAPIGELDLLQDPSGFTCLSLAAAQPLVAAGTVRGAVAIWDSTKKQVVHVDSARHVGGTAAVQFAPLDTTVLYTAGADGTLFMQDLRAGPFQRPTLRFDQQKQQNRAEFKCMSVREDGLSVAVGTADGRVMLFDPRNSSAVPTALHSSAMGAVTCVHWQHNYQSLSSKARSTEHSVAGHVEGHATSQNTALPAPAPSGPVEAAAPPHSNRLSLTSSLGSHWDPPKKLDATPVPAGRPSMYASPAVPKTAVSPAPSSAAVSLDGPRTHTQSHMYDQTRPSPAPTTAAATAPREASRALEGGGDQAPWSIKAGPSKQRAGPHNDNSAGQEGGSGAEGVSLGIVGAEGSLRKGVRAHPPGKAAPLLGVSSSSSSPLEDLDGVHGLRQDLLALHLDMLNQFQEQQAARDALMAGVVQRQDALMEEVNGLRRQLHDLLTRRDGTLWL